MSYTRAGTGRPIVMLHGWCLNSSYWCYAEEHFRATHQVISPDLAGFGRSDHLDGPYTFTRYADDVAHLLDALELSGAIVVGFAFGAIVAMEMAARPGARLSAIVAIGAPKGDASPYDRMARSMRRDWPDFGRRSARALFHRPQSDATLSFVENMFCSTRLAIAVDTVTLMTSLEPAQIAARARVPQLYVHGDHDSVSPVAVGESCVSAGRNGRLEVIEDCGHAIPLDQPAKFHEVLSRFVNSL